jgi:hypothetical protein
VVLPVRVSRVLHAYAEAVENSYPNLGPFVDTPTLNFIEFEYEIRVPRVKVLSR